MPYTKNTWVDEVLAAAARYDILEDGGGAFKADMQINLATTVTQAGSALNALKMNNIEGELQIISDLLLYKFSVTVVSNDLVVTLQHSDGTNPTSTRPLYFRIGGTWRAVTTTTTITIADGTNWFNAGSVELGTKIVGYFVYTVWDSNSSVVALTIARIPYARVVSDFITTTTSERHCFNFTNFTSTDPVANIGYFEATLSLTGTGHLWTVPTFTNANLQPEPTFETGWLLWTPTPAGWSVNPTFTVFYKIEGTKLTWFVVSAAGTSNATTATITLPFTSVNSSGLTSWSNGRGQDNAAECSPIFRVSSNASTLDAFKGPGTTAWTNSGTKFFSGEGFYRIA